MMQQHWIKIITEKGNLVLLSLWRLRLQLTIILFLAIVSGGCFIFDKEGELLYQKGKYSIRKKNIISYYQASPDLFVATDKGEVKINLNGFGKRQIAQEKITHIELKEINNDSIQIYFSTTDKEAPVKNETISVNIKYAVDSILSGKK